LRVVLGVLRLVVALLIVATAVPAILAIFGSLLAPLDILNHLQLLLFFGTLLALVLALAVRMRRWAVLLGILGLCASGWTYVPEWLSSLSPRPAAAAGAPTLKLMTHNVFGLNYDMARVARVIFAEDPDIVALQEYFPEQMALDGLLKPKYPYSVRCQGGKRANLGLYSKIPFDKEMSAADCPADAFGKQRTAHIIAGFTLSDGTHFSVMTTHMDWPFPIDRQREEFEAAESAANAIKGPLLVVGDFNSTPYSYAMKRFETATGVTRETRNVVTYPIAITVPRRVSRSGLLRLTPFLPLDQVFERDIAVTELHRGPETGSDHLPVVFTFAVKR
jgi:endonuclease/exonuclease/phosphatase (EEP) superfamily protein YafD